MNGDRMDLLKHMQLFVRIVEHGSFSRAAAETGLTQPTISKGIAALEKHLGAQLLSRTTRHVSLTEDGSRYYEHCVVILNELEQAESAIDATTSEPRGPIKERSGGRVYAVDDLDDDSTVDVDIDNIATKAPEDSGADDEE